MIVNIVVAAVALLHIYFLILEMFLWTKPRGLRVFRQSKEKAQATAVLAANQGLYNGFLAAGLIWSMLHPNLETSSQLKIFFLSCVGVAGIYGGMTVNRRIFFIQGVPAMLGLILIVVF